MEMYEKQKIMISSKLSEKKSNKQKGTLMEYEAVGKARRVRRKGGLGVCPEGIPGGPYEDSCVRL